MLRALVTMAVIALSGAWAGGSDSRGTSGSRDGVGASGDPDRQGRPRGESSAHRKSAADSIREWRMVYLKSIQDRLADIDRELRRLARDSLAMDTSMNLQYRQVLEKARTARDHVDNLKDDLTAVKGDIPSQPWDTLQARMTLSMDDLERLFFAADSANRDQKDRERRARQGAGGQGARGSEGG